MTTHNFTTKTEGDTTTILFATKKDRKAFEKDFRNRNRIVEEVRQQSGSRFVSSGVKMTEKKAAQIARKFDAMVSEANRPEMTDSEAWEMDNKVAEKARRFKNATL